jgi:cysteine desulfurase/selenocysteine lyase
MSFDVPKVRKDFPIFERTIRDGKKLVYLDSGATSQKPLSVIDAESNFYQCTVGRIS